MMSGSFEDFLAELGGSKVSKDLDFEIFKGTDIGLASHVPYGIPTGIPCLDLALGRPGLPAGRVIECFGFEHCIDADTFIQYQVRNKNGKVQNSKGGSLENLYYRFHRIVRKGSGYRKSPSTINSDFFVPSMNDEGYIQANKVMDVVDAGTQFCYELTTNLGLKIIATENHKFCVEHGYLKLKELNPGDTILTSIGERVKGRKDYTFRPEVYVKCHPLAKTRVIGGKYYYKRLTIARATYEAYLNNLTYNDYIDRLNEGKLDGLQFVGLEFDIHHIDENFTNNSPDNLVALTRSEHHKHHANKNQKLLSFIVSKDNIKSIEPIGLRKVYDIKMQAPYHNYVANKFVVHNSGKSSLALSIVASAQRMGGYALWIDTERTFDPIWARTNGCDPDRIIIGEVDSIEAAFNLQLKALEARENSEDKSSPFVIVLDSVTAVPSLESIERTFDQSNRIGTDARAIRDSMRRVVGKIADTKALSVYVNHSISKTAATPFAKQSQSSGGHSIKFFSSIRLEMISCGFIKTEINDEKYKTGLKVKCKIEKNKVSSTGKMEIETELLGNGFDLASGLFEGLLEVEKIQKINSKSYKFTVPKTDEVIQFTKAEWPEIINQYSTGPDSVYKWFLSVAQQKNLIKGYNQTNSEQEEEENA